MQVKHSNPIAGVNVAELVQAGEYRGKSWRLAESKYDAPATFAGQQAELCARAIHASRSPYSALVSMSQDTNGGWVLLHMGDDNKFKVNPSLDAGAVRWQSLSGRSTQKALLVLLQSVANDGNLLVGNLWPDRKVKAATPDHEDINMQMMKNHFRNFSREKFNEFIGDAKLHVKNNTASDLEQAALTVQVELKSYVHDVSEAMSILEKVEGTGDSRRIPADFRTGVLDLTGSVWDARNQTVKTQSIDSWLNKPGKHNYLKTTLVLVGGADCGKSEFARAVARELAYRHDFERFGYCKNLDIVGRLSMVGMMDKIGAFVFADFELKTKLERRPLSEEEVKGLLDPNEPGGYDCRYHPAVFAKWTPRVWTLNTGLDDEGEQSFEQWFETQLHTDALAALSRSDGDWLRSASAHDQAIGRRAFVVKISEPLYEIQGEDAESDTDDHFHSGMKRKYVI